MNTHKHAQQSRVLTVLDDIHPYQRDWHGRYQGEALAVLMSGRT